MELQGAKAYVLRQSAPFVTEHTAWPLFTSLPPEQVTIWICAMAVEPKAFPCIPGSPPPVKLCRWFGFRGDFSDTLTIAEYQCWGLRVCGELGILP